MAGEGWRSKREYGGPGVGMSLLCLPSQSAAGEVAYTMEIFISVVEVRSLRSRCQHSRVLRPLFLAG